VAEACGSGIHVLYHVSERLGFPALEELLDPQLDLSHSPSDHSSVPLAIGRAAYSSMPTSLQPCPCPSPTSSNCLTTRSLLLLLGGGATPTVNMSSWRSGARPTTHRITASRTRHAATVATTHRPMPSGKSGEPGVRSRLKGEGVDDGYPGAGTAIEVAGGEVEVADGQGGGDEGAVDAFKGGADVMLLWADVGE